MELCLQVKQYITKIRLPNGQQFQVYTTGDPRYLLLAQLDPDNCATGLQVPVLKKDLKRGWKRFSVAD